MLQKWLFYLQKIIDISIPLGFMLAQANFALRIVELPPSLVATIHDQNTAWFWAFGSFIAYAMIIVGVILKPPPRTPNEKKKKGFGGAFLWFEFPGLITAGILTSVYPLALWVQNGLFSQAFAVICFILTIAIYFVLRFIRQILLLKLAKNNLAENKVLLTGM